MPTLLPNHLSTSQGWAFYQALTVCVWCSTVCVRARSACVLPARQFKLAAVACAVISLATAAPVVIVSPEVVPRSGDTVAVTWSGVESPTYWDRIAVFAAATSEVAMGYFYVNTTSTWSSGNGSIIVPYLVNMRNQYVFKYLQVRSGQRAAFRSFKGPEHVGFVFDFELLACFR